MSSSPETSKKTAISHPCEHCPWRVSNHGKRTPWGFYRKRNLRRLWNEIRRGGHPQSCHPTDASHPDHIAAGAEPGGEVEECAGSVILVLREIEKILTYSEDGHTITPEAVEAYLAENKGGLTRGGVAYWVLSRIQFAGVPMLGEPALPVVDREMGGIGRPE